MIEITVKSDGRAEEDLKESADRARNLDRRNAAVIDAILRANEDANLDAMHPNTILRVGNGEGAVGATDPRGPYAELLDIPDDEIAEIYHRYIVDGD